MQNIPERDFLPGNRSYDNSILNVELLIIIWPVGRWTYSIMVTQKGEIRRNQLISCALSLLSKKSPNEISLQMIAENADIPVSSAYHFFKNASDIFQACATRFGAEFIEALTCDYPEEKIHRWQDLYRIAVDRAVDIYNRTPAYCELILGPHSPASIKLRDRKNDAEMGIRFVDVIDRYFVVFRQPDIEEKMFYSIEIVDLFLSLSFTYHHALVPEIIEEAKDAGLAYMERYLPPILPKRNP